MNYSSSLSVVVFVLVLPLAANAEPPESADIASLRQAYQASETEARETAARMRTIQPKTDAKLRQKLHAEVERSFQIRQQLGEAELKALQRKLEQARQSIAMRNRLQGEIITRRVADLLNPARRWDADEADSGKTRLPSTPPAAPRPDGLAASIPAHLEFLLEPLWPLQKKRNELLNVLTQMELQRVELLQPVKIPPDAQPDVKERLEDDKKRTDHKARELQDRIDSLRAEVDGLDRQISLLKMKLEIKGLVVSSGDEGRVEISIGHDDGVQRGMKFSVFDGETTTGLVEIVQVEADRSIARIIMEGAETPIRRGQRATLPIDRILSEIVGHDPGEPIYNDRLKRFKFRLERISVTNEYETAEQFWRIYQGRGNPSITGVWGDPRTNSLVIVGPPEADQAIRDTLAEWEGAMSGIEFEDDGSLETQHTHLQRRRKAALEQLTSRKLEVIDAEAAGENADGERLKKLKLELARDVTELETVERKLQVVIESMERLRQDPSRENPANER